MELIYAIVIIGMINVTGWITPGPNMIAVMSASMSMSRAHGFMVGAGMGLAAFVWSGLAIMGMTTLFELYPGFSFTLKFAGALYLIWLGIKAFRASFKRDKTLQPSALRAHNMASCFRTGFLVSMTNPKAALFFGSVLTAFVPTNSPTWFLVTIVFFCGILSVILHMITASVFSTELSVRVFQRFRKSIETLFGIVFAGSGLAIMVSAFNRTP